MRKSQVIIALSVVLAVILLPITAFAADITDALWKGDIRITNSGNSTASVVSVNCSINSASLIDNGFASANFSDVALLYNDADVAFMPSVNASYPWAFFVPSIGANTYTSYDLYTGGATGGKIRYFPTAEGMTSSDNASMELGDNWTIVQSGWVDTAAGANKTLVNKEGAFRTFVSPTVSGNITSVMTPWVSPTGGVAAGWADVAKAYDGNTATFAFKNVAGAGAKTYEATHAGVISDQCQWWIGYTASLTNFKVEAYYGGAYHTVLEDITPTTDVWVSAPYPDSIQTTTKLKFTFTLDGAGGDIKVYEADFGSASQAVTVTGVSSEEHIVITKMETPFWGLRVDADVALPVNDNLVFNAPFWQTELSGSPFTSFDAYGHTCTVTGSIWFPTYRDFDGNDLIDCGADAVLKNLGVSANFTIEWWGYSDYNWGGQAERGLAGNRARNNPLDDGIVVIVEDDVTGTLRVEISDGVTDEKLHWTNKLSPNVWEHIVLTYDEPTDTMELFVSAVSQGTNVFSQKITTSANVWNVGVELSGRFYIGRIGEMRVYTRVLTDIEIDNNYNTTKWKYDGTINKEVRSAFAITDNSTDWSYYHNLDDYWEYTKITINDVLQQHIEWEYDTVFSDLSGNSHDATPTFRTTSSNANVSASLISFSAVNESKVSTFTLASTYAILTGTPDTPGGMFVDGDYSKLPAAPINVILDAADVPRAAWWLPFLFLGICVIGFIAYGATTMVRGPTGKLREGQIDGSLLLMFIVMEAMLAALGKMGPIPYWPTFIFPIAGIAIILSRKHFSWG